MLNSLRNGSIFLRQDKIEIVVFEAEGKAIGIHLSKTVFQFCVQYLYYIFEVMLVTLIIIYGQKAVETLLKKESPIPFGGIILAVTWGAFHFVSRV